MLDRVKSDKKSYKGKSSRTSYDNYYNSNGRFLREQRFFHVRLKALRVVVVFVCGGVSWLTFLVKHLKCLIPFIIFK